MATAVAGCMEARTVREIELIHLLRERKLFADVSEAELACLIAASTEWSRPAGVVLAKEHEQQHDFFVLFSGDVRISRRGSGDVDLFHKTVSAPSFMGESAILSHIPYFLTVTSITDVSFLRMGEDSFWQLMATCPNLRDTIVSEARMRTQGHQAMATQEGKLSALGAMTAGLMHELNNPGAAAKRAASQLRANLTRLHLLARSFAEQGHTEGQRACLTALQERVLGSGGARCMDSLQQSDAEEALGMWMDEHDVNNAWNLAPTLVASGIAAGDLDCLQHVFPADAIQEPIEWLEATASSMQQVALVEESVSRVHELAKAVKTYVHEGQGGQQTVYVNESVHATLMLLKHKFREKNIHLEKQFGANLHPLTCVCSGLNQIWTNLLDNAIDAVSPDGHIQIRTWQDAASVFIAIHDDGPGIPESEQERIFDPFYTTKPAGVGTGMGLGIVHRIVESYNGSLTLHSVPGETEFVVRIPVVDAPAGKTAT